MQQPTCTNLRIRHISDADRVLEGVRQGLLHMITRPLNVEECNALRPGHVYAWDDRCSQSESTGSGTERFADGRHWGASRQRDVRSLRSSAITSSSIDI